MAFSARPTSTDLLTKLVNQVLHNFQVGDIVRFNGTIFVKAQADIPGNCHGVVMVSIVVDANSFYYSDAGFVNSITAIPTSSPNFVPGTQYYLSESAQGRLTSVAPSVIGQVVLPCFLALTTTSGEFFSNPGTMIIPNAQTPWITISADQPLQINKNYWVDPTSVAELQLTLPSTMGTSDQIQVAAPAGMGFKILQNAVPAQYIDFVQLQTAHGAGGSIELDVTGGLKAGSLTINCHITNTAFMITGSTGNFIVT